MDKYAHRRSALKRLVDGFGHGGISRVATKIGKEPNYVSRMLYPDDKPGRKRIGEDSAELLSREFPGWLEELAGTGATGEQDYLPDLVLVDEAHHSQPTATVFEVKEPQAQFGFTAAPTCESALVSLSHTLDRITPPAARCRPISCDEMAARRGQCERSRPHDRGTRRGQQQDRHRNSSSQQVTIVQIAESYPKVLTRVDTHG